MDLDMRLGGITFEPFWKIMHYVIALTIERASIQWKYIFDAKSIINFNSHFGEKLI